MWYKIVENAKPSRCPKCDQKHIIYKEAHPPTKAKLEPSKVVVVYKGQCEWCGTKIKEHYRLEHTKTYVPAEIEVH